MADRIPPRSANRRATPQSPRKSTGSRSIASTSPPRRTMRTTRSQSYGVSDSEASRLGARGTGKRGSRQASTETTDVNGGRVERIGRKSKSKAQNRVWQELSTVVESPSIVYPNLDTRTERGDGNDGIRTRTSSHEVNSPGVRSAFSGTTARTSRSAQELAGLFVDEMLDALPDLSDASDRVLRQLLSEQASNSTIADIRDHFQKPDSKASRKLRRLATVFQAQKDIYGNDFYINSALVLTALLGGRHASSVEYGPWRPDLLLQKANLSTLVMAVLTLSRKDDNDQTIEELERVFPNPFLSNFVGTQIMDISAGSSAIISDTFQIALELRTQVLILLLTRHIGEPNFDPDVILEQVFWQEPRTLKGWDLEGLRAGNLESIFSSAILRRLEHIRHCFSEDFPTSDTREFVNLNSLRTRFPWNTFVTEAVAWSRTCLEEIERQTKVCGGITNIQRALQIEIENQGSVNLTRIGDNRQDAQANSPPVEIDYEPPPELSNVPSDQFLQPRQAFTRATKLVATKTSFNSPKNLPRNVARLKQRFGQSSRPDAIQRGQPAPSSVQILATAALTTKVISPTRRVERPVNPVLAPTVSWVERGSKIQDDDELRPSIFQDQDEDHPSIDSDRDLSAVASQVSQVQAQREAESNEENLADGQRLDLSPTLQQPPGRHGKERRKRRLIDAQPVAVRVRFGSQEPDEVIRTVRSGPADSQGQIDDDEEQIEGSSQDMGFQSNTAGFRVESRRSSLAPGRRNMADLPKTQRQAQKRVRIHSKEPVNASNASVEGETDFEDDIRRATNRHSVASNPPSSQAENYKKVKSSAKLRTAVLPKKVQSRKPWSDQETQRLIEMIEEYGTSWALLKMKDKESILGSRDQTALKDKARNMKVDYLKELVHLPDNFEHIALNQMQIDKLRIVGVTYNSETGTVVGEDRVPWDEDD